MEIANARVNMTMKAAQSTFVSAVRLPAMAATLETDGCAFQTSATAAASPSATAATAAATPSTTATTAAALESIVTAWWSIRNLDGLDGFGRLKAFWWWSVRCLLWWAVLSLAWGSGHVNWWLLENVNWLGKYMS